MEFENLLNQNKIIRSTRYYSGVHSLLNKTNKITYEKMGYYIFN